MKRKWKKLPPIKGSIACLTCGCGSHDTLDMNSILGVGFGDVTVSKDGEHVWSEQEAVHKAESGPELEQCWTGKDAEKVAAKDPNHDWRIHFFAPLYESTYQRQGKNHWVLVEKGMGFA